MGGAVSDEANLWANLSQHTKTILFKENTERGIEIELHTFDTINRSINGLRIQ